MLPRHHIRFPSEDVLDLRQDEVWFFLEEEGETHRIRFHDYGALYARPGLYEQLFYDRLKCTSPNRVGEILEGCVSQARLAFNELRVLDVGAGNGVMGEVLAQWGVARLVGIDILEEARLAAERDRPGIYDAYYVTDLTCLPESLRQELAGWRFDCMTTVAALGFGDIPLGAFATAWSLVETNGWIAFNVRETFLDERDESGFSRLIRTLLRGQHFELHHLERYRHRVSIDGAPLHYYAVVGRKRHDLDPELIARLAPN